MGTLLMWFNRIVLATARKILPSVTPRNVPWLRFHQQALFAITNLDLTRFILPHQHSAPARCPVPTLPLQLQQTVLVTHYPVLTHHRFFLQPEHLVELSRRRSPPMIISFRRRRPCITPVVLGDVVLLQIAIGLVVASDPGQP